MFLQVAELKGQAPLSTLEPKRSHRKSQIPIKEFQDLFHVLVIFNLLWHIFSFLYIHSSFLRWECLLCATVCWKYITYFLI